MSECTVVLATRNAGKIRELAEPLASFGLRVVGLDVYPDMPEVEETGETFMANAFLKARSVADHTGHMAIADDSGLIVPVLGGEPGVRSARYWQPGDILPGVTDEAVDGMPQDERNIRKLLANLEGRPDTERGASFYCAMCAVHPGRTQPALEVHGQWEGCILHAPRGKGGFGYDPLFFDEELRCSAAEMPRDVKMARSHRSKALTQLLAVWETFQKG